MISFYYKKIAAITAITKNDYMTENIVKGLFISVLLSMFSLFLYLKKGAVGIEIFLFVIGLIFMVLFFLWVLNMVFRTGIKYPLSIGLIAFFVGCGVNTYYLIFEYNNAKLLLYFSFVISFVIFLVTTLADLFEGKINNKRGKR